MEKICFLTSLGIITVLHILAILAKPTICTSVDQSVLVSLKESISISSTPDNLIVKNWSVNAPVCSWIGVACNKRHQRVTELNLANMGLVGRVPPQLGNLSFLDYLNLSGNGFYGVLPGELARLHRLKFMDLSNNSFSGTIPSSLGLLPKLQNLRLAINSFTGAVPKTVWNISTLETIGLHQNKFSANLPENICHGVPELRRLTLAFNDINGTIPSDISGCTKLQVLALQNNHLAGTIPRNIGNLTMLRLLYLGSNNLEGFLPDGLGNLYSLEVLNLQDNILTGSIPDSIFNMSTLIKLALTQNYISGFLPPNLGMLLPNLQELYLSINNFFGVIPDSISNSSNLMVLDLSGNQFSGRIPNSLGNLRFLDTLALSLNNLEADKELGFLTSLIGCRHLREITVGGNPLNGIIPATIGNISSLKILAMSLCRIKGEIPKQIGNLSNLVLLSLSFNYLAGVIPIEVNGLQSLQGLYFQNNDIGGSIPLSLCHLQNLSEVALASNHIFGSLPQCFSNLSSLRKIHLGSNELNSGIPASLWNLRNILYINLTSNFLNGSLPLALSSISDVVVFDLSKNQFSGNIPNAFSDMANLVNLSLANNRFQGPVPDSISEVTGLEMLDLSNNSLTGMIPKSFEALHNLWYFNVSFNKLSGEIPSGGPFGNLTYLSFMSNEALCGKPQFGIPPCRGNNLDRSRKKKLLLVVILPTTIAFLALVLTIVLVLRYRKKNVKPQQVDLIPNIMHERISYIQLERATDRFSDGKLLGSGSFGSVFKGSFSDGTFFAVKVFHLNLEGAFRSFEIECEVFRRLRHRNLTKVFSSCSNPDFKALVLEYMPNGSLEKWIHSNSLFLDIVQRLDIMTDVAFAIEYLHHGNTTPVIHCDLKPSNVLLDEEMVGHVSDFGIAKLLGEEENIRHTTTLATLGYVAPEYGAEGLVSTSCDVYSYGILLMETFTRRCPTDEMFSEGSSLTSWVGNFVPGAVDQVIDGNLISADERHLNEKLMCVSSLMALAVNCASESPQRRPNMKDVVVSLKKIKIQLLAR